MKTIILSTFVVLLSVSSFAHAEAFRIPLTAADQTRLAREMSKIDYKYKSEEFIEDGALSYTFKKYDYLNEDKSFFINCSEKFRLGSPYGSDQKCEIGFNYALSENEAIFTHDGFMENFAIAEIKDVSLARDLYKTINNGVGISVFFQSAEQLTFTHSKTGQLFSVARLRIDCKRDNSYKVFDCMVSAVK